MGWLRLRSFISLRSLRWSCGGLLLAATHRSRYPREWRAAHLVRLGLLDPRGGYQQVVPPSLDQWRERTDPAHHATGARPRPQILPVAREAEYETAALGGEVVSTLIRGPGGTFTVPEPASPAEDVFEPQTWSQPQRQPPVTSPPGEAQPAPVGLRQYLQEGAGGQARRQACYAALSGALLIATTDGRVIDFNPAAVALFGDGETLTRRRIQDLLPMVEAPQAHSPQEFSWQGTIADARGTRRDVDVSRSNVEPDGVAPADLYLVQDVTRLTDLSRQREELLYHVAHELRGPLGVLENLLDVLGDGEGGLTPAQAGRLLGASRRTVSRARELMESLLAAGSIQSGRVGLDPRPVRVSALFDQAIDATQGQLSDRRQRIEIALVHEDLIVVADPLHVGRVLTNLLSNASKYSPEDESIRLEAAPRGAFIRIAVEDRGLGLSPEERAGLFRRFYRARSPAETPGIGLGLAIARGIVEAHGGRVGAESVVGQGTTIWFTLRAAEDTT